MMEDDTIKLLRECDAGCNMGIDSIDNVIEDVDNAEMKNLLLDSKNRHIDIRNKIDELLHEFHDDGKEPPMMASMMSKMKTEFEMMMDCTAQTAAKLITDGCDMGTKSISEYFNKYPAADERVKKLVWEIVEEEDQLRKQLRPYL